MPVRLRSDTRGVECVGRLSPDAFGRATGRSRCTALASARSASRSCLASSTVRARGCFGEGLAIGPASRTGLRSMASWRVASRHMPLRTDRVALAVDGPCSLATARKCLSIVPVVSSRTRRLPREGMTWRLRRSP